MSLKKTDLARLMGLKIEGKMKRQGVPPRFGQGARAVARTERPALSDKPAEQAPSLVPMTCKLPAPLAARLRDAAAAHPGKLNGLMAELLTQALPQAPVAQPAVTQKPVAKKATAQKAAAKKAVAKTAAVKQPATKKAAAKKATAKTAPARKAAGR
ncbi:hypothetical protein [Aquabacterium fontiphilum]|uniref:hypothetical protein n=1 Tax=Aquabacterium fontiphilum TaxID=450365 RepID=UPI001F433FD8|nr:hypothetical protein [Aquabacterium fontiphilum]